ncbi:hypothetical protein B0H17DRAFT_1093918 [Mycena rosella]|uniref:Uncharacterized protein n=1 Tax=Mycena rosella TaxID=1033263 RepID=A0AAD7CWF9_MYCRO|nr:hypothetical protein B0H17DRAFT_1093918 [Mycena rosella]
MPPTAPLAVHIHIGFQTLQHHDWFTATLTACLCVGLVISYLPQHFRIIHQGTSEGLSPWFLLLGSTSSAAGFLNMITVQHTQIRCCRVVSIAACVESTAGIVQVGLQWAMFSFMCLRLYMLYFPPHLKYVESTDLPPRRTGKAALVRSQPWARSVLLANVTIAHFILSAALTLFLLLSSPPRRARHLPYLPQITTTWYARLVGALSVPMMCVQSPGAVAMVLSIALRPGTNWTSWITYAVAGLMQGTLLAICIAWKIRQRRLRIDDFGAPLSPSSDTHPSAPSSAPAQYRDAEEEEGVPGLVVGAEEDAGAVTKALASALGEAVAGDVREGSLGGEGEGEGSATNLLGQTEATSLLAGQQGKGKGRAGWW